MKVKAFHSSKTPGVYHISNKCTEGDNIEPQYKKEGTGGGRLCAHCARLQSQGRL